MNGNVKLGRAAARSGEWAQHFSNASCYTHLRTVSAYVNIYDTIRNISLAMHTSESFPAFIQRAQEKKVVDLHLFRNISSQLLA